MAATLIVGLSAKGTRFRNPECPAILLSQIFFEVASLADVANRGHPGDRAICARGRSLSW